MVYASDIYRFEDDELHVVCCECALTRCGLSYTTGKFLKTFTSKRELDNLNLGIAAFVYNSNIDCSNFVRPVSNTDKILIPTKERAIVESIKFKDYCDEGILIEAIKNYLGSFKNFVELYKVAQFYNVDKYEIDYWIKEAEEYDMEG